MFNLFFFYFYFDCLLIVMIVQFPENKQFCPIEIPETPIKCEWPRAKLLNRKQNENPWPPTTIYYSYHDEKRKGERTIYTNVPVRISRHWLDHDQVLNRPQFSLPRERSTSADTYPVAWYSGTFSEKRAYHADVHLLEPFRLHRSLWNWVEEEEEEEENDMCF